MRMLQYYDLFTSDVFGPEPNHESNKHCIMIILRKGMSSSSWLIVVLFFHFAAHLVFLC